MRVPAGRVLLAALAAALVAASAASADATDPRTKPTRADQARANASLLRFADLGPAWTGAAEKPASLKIPVCPGNQPDNSDLTLTGHAESYVELKSEGLLVDTDVEVFKTAGQVDRLFGRMSTKLLTACLKYDLLKSVGGNGAQVGKVTALALPSVGTHRVAYRVALTYNKQPIVSDYLLLSAGRTQFFVNVVAPGPVAGQLPQLEARVAKVLAARAKG